jgi:hypothetical protein
MATVSRATWSEDQGTYSRCRPRPGRREPSYGPRLNRTLDLHRIPCH